LNLVEWFIVVIEKTGSYDIDLNISMYTWSMDVCNGASRMRPSSSAAKVQMRLDNTDGLCNFVATGNSKTGDE